MIITPFCDKCGKPVSADQNFCIRCGRALQPLLHSSPIHQTAPGVEPIVLGAQQPHQFAPAAELGKPQVRPTGVTLLVILMVIGGVMDIVTSTFFLVLAAFSLSLPEISVVLSIGSIPSLFLWIALLLSGPIFFVLAYGLWKGRAWAWTWTFVSSVVSLIASAVGIIIGIGVVGLVIYPIILFYLTRARVRIYFGKQTHSKQKEEKPA